MNWFALLMNDRPLSLYYDAPPSLEQVGLHEIAMDRNGPRIKLRFDLCDFVDRPPAKWDATFNTVQVLLSFIDIDSLFVKGWSCDNQVNIELSREAEAVQVRITGNDTRMTFRSRFVNLDKVSAYCNT